MCTPLIHSTMTGRYSTNEGSKDGKSSSIRYIKPVVFILAICTTVLLFTLPIIFYYLTAYTDLATASSEGYLNSLNINLTVNGSLPCDSSTILSWGVIEDSVTECEPYTGTICLPYLIQWNQCILPGGGDQEEIHVAVNSNGKTQDILEEELLEMQSLLANFPNCHPIAVPFLCHHYFPLMAAECQSTTVNDDQPLYTVTQEDCINIRDNICAVPWQLADAFGLGDRLPDCQLLPLSIDINESTLIQTPPASSLPVPTSNETISCRDDFFCVNNTCLPRCDRFQGYPPDVVTALLTVEVLSSVLGVTTSVLIILLSVYYRHNMFKFPSFFVVFYSVNYLLIGVIFLVLAVDRTKLSCSSISLIESLANPTMFCTVSGAALQYLSVSTSTWWFFHLCMFFYEIAFPFHAYRMRKFGKMKYIAATLIPIGLVIPIPGVIVPLTMEEYQYQFSRFPPTVCVPDAHVWFYSTNLVFTVTIGIGVCLLITILWLINRNQSSSAERSGIKQKLTTAEKKIIVVFISFICFGVFSMVHYGLVSGNISRATEVFTDYFLCESTGHVPGKCDRSEFERRARPEMSIITYLLLGIIPIATLNYVINWSNLLKSIKCFILRILPSTDNSRAGTINNNNSTSSGQSVSSSTAMMLTASLLQHQPQQPSTTATLPMTTGIVIQVGDNSNNGSDLRSALPEMFKTI